MDGGWISKLEDVGVFADSNAVSNQVLPTEEKSGLFTGVWA